jgi:6-phosphogluconate dehydrogenase, C-terminal domain
MHRHTHTHTHLPLPHTDTRTHTYTHTHTHTTPPCTHTRKSNLRVQFSQVDDLPCSAYIGPIGSGNYVKMVHNGIEYGTIKLLFVMLVLLWFAMIYYVI